MAASKKQTQKRLCQQSKIAERSSISSDRKAPVWIFDKIDRSGDYAFDVSREDFNHKLVLEKIIEYASMSWIDVKQQTHGQKGKSKNHYYPLNEMSSTAQKRFVQLGLDEYGDSIFSFAVSSVVRIIGYRENEYFHVLWYDAQHEVYPSKKKHT